MIYAYPHKISTEPIIHIDLLFIPNPNDWFGIKWLSLLQQVLVCQEIQESDSQHTEFVLLAMNVIPNNDNLKEVVIDWQ